MNKTRLSDLYPGWTTVRPIGAGSFGTVYEIERDLFGKKEKSALKVISIPQNQGDVEDLYSNGYDDASVTAHFEGYLADIVREYSLMAEMKGHTNVVYCDDIRYARHEDGIGWDIFIKMELLTPMLKVLDKSWNDTQVIKLGMDICSALILCKDKNIVHRDIKPQNIFVSPSGDYKLGDFGIAKTVEQTTGGTKIGTYNYMAPEVYHNQPYGSAADIYSLGLVMYWLLNERRLPFLPLPPNMPTASEIDAARTKRFSGSDIPAPAHGSSALKQIVLKACAYNPSNRYASAQDMLDDLHLVSQGNGANIAAETETDIEEEKTAGPQQKRSDELYTADADKTVGPRYDKSNHATRKKAFTHIKISKKAWLIGSCTFALISLIFGSGLLIKHGNFIFPNVSIGQHSVGGMSKTRAVELLEQTLFPTEDICIILPDRQIVLDAKQLDLSWNIDEVVEQAYSIPRHNLNALSAIGAFLTQLSPDNSIVFHPEAQYNAAYIETQLQAVTDSVEQNRVQPKIDFDEANRKLIITVGTSGKTLHPGELWKTICGNIESGIFSDINWTYSEEVVDKLDLSAYHARYCQPAKNAEYDKANRTIIPETTGYDFDLAEAEKKLANAAAGAQVEILLRTIVPEITASNYEAVCFPDVLSSYTIEAASHWDADDKTNLQLACAAVNGIVLDPGEEFSFNAATGERTEESGYKSVGTIANELPVRDQVAGNVCTVTNALYCSALLADFEVTERKNHVYPSVSEVPWGFDAAVCWGDLDLKFKNTNATPVMIKADMNDGNVNISIIGVSEHSYNIKLAYEILETLPWYEQEILDELKPEGYREMIQAPYTGYVIQTLREYYDAGGNFICKTECDVSEYAKADKVYVVGPDSYEDIPDDILQGILDGTIDLDAWLRGEYDNLD